MKTKRTRAYGTLTAMVVLAGATVMGCGGISLHPRPGSAGGGGAGAGTLVLLILFALTVFLREGRSLNRRL